MQYKGGVERQATWVRTSVNDKRHFSLATARLVEIARLYDVSVHLDPIGTGEPKFFDLGRREVLLLHRLGLHGIKAAVGWVEDVRP